MLDPAMQQFADEMRARPRPKTSDHLIQGRSVDAPRRASTRRSGDIGNSSSCGAAALARRIVQFWGEAGYDIQVEIIRAGGPHESQVWGIRSDMIGGLPAALRADARKS